MFRSSVVGHYLIHDHRHGLRCKFLTVVTRTSIPLLLSHDVQDNYPELMYKTLIINAPTTFRVLWAMVRHLMDARTQAKIEVRRL